jgi:hypothetical protein
MCTTRSRTRGWRTWIEAVAEHIMSELIPRESLIFFDDWLPGGSTELHVHRLESSGMTEEESLKSFTRRSLKALDNWEEWDAAFDLQLDRANSSGVPHFLQ